jgi:hypothetical protein
MWYFHKRGCPKIHIRELYGSPAFWARYAELRKKVERGEPKAAPRNAPAPGRWRWLCVEFFGSATGLLALDPKTQHVRRQALESTFGEAIAPGDPHTFGDCPLRHFTDESVRIMRNRKKDLPEAANVRIKAISRVFKWGLEEISAHERKRHGITGNPARDVARLKSKNPGGHHTWTIEEI